MEPDSFDRLIEISHWGLLAIILMVPAMVILIPLPRVRVLPPLFQMLGAALCTQFLIYLLFYCMIFPAADSVRRAHRGILLDYHTLDSWVPHSLWAASLIISLVYTLIGFSFLAGRQPNNLSI